MGKALIAGMAILASLAVAGCKYTGGGTFDGNSGKANFGFTYDSSKGKLAGTLHDGDVRFSFTGPPAQTGEGVGCVRFNGTYTSTNPRARGTGTLQVEVCDGGEGAGSSPDLLYVKITSGPFSGYEYSGPAITGGNIQDHTDYSSLTGP